MMSCCCFYIQITTCMISVIDIYAVVRGYLETVKQEGVLTTACGCLHFFKLPLTGIVLDLLFTSVHEEIELMNK